MKRILIASAIGLAALTAGCTGTTGEAKPDPTTSSSAPTGDSKLASIKPCELLSEAEATGLGYTYPGEDADIGTADGCDWIISGNGGTSASIRTKSGIKDLNPKSDKISDVKIGRFSGLKVEAPDGDKGACTILISVTDGSSVSILSTMGASLDTSAACERASKVADLVGQKLS
ncbi:DUF3558 domain-containing protein [Lentzea sp. NPDC054927]